VAVLGLGSVRGWGLQGGLVPKEWKEGSPTFVLFYSSFCHGVIHHKALTRCSLDFQPPDLGAQQTSFLNKIPSLKYSVTSPENRGEGETMNSLMFPIFVLTGESLCANPFRNF
jgi:hypothetical protein